MAQTRDRIVKKVLFQKAFCENSNLSRAYYIHAIRYGDFIDVRYYNNVKVTFNGKDRIVVRQPGGNKRSDSLNRARQSLYRLIHANCFKHGKYRPVFTTYTFQTPHTDITQVNAMFRLFVRRLSYFTKKRLQYIVVPEIQKEREKKEGHGVWHFHVIWFNLPWINYSKHEELWSHGWSQIEAVRSIRDIGAYVSKYLSKDIFECRLYGKKTYYTSRGLIRPVEFFDKTEVDNFLKSWNNKVIDHYEGQNYTQIKYKLYDAN